MLKKILLLGATLVAAGAFAQKIETDRTGWPKSITFASVPIEGSADATTRFKPVVEILKERLGIDITFRNGADYTAVILAMQNKQVDFAAFGTASYLDAEDRANAEAFVRDDAIVGGTGYFSYLITRADSGIKTIEDAKGKDFSFVDPASTSGFRVPMFNFCSKLKIEPTNYFGKVQFAGTHENVVIGVARGNIPFGATNNLSLESAIDKGIIKKDDIRIVYKSTVIPGGPFAYRKDLPATLKAAIKKVMLELNQSAKGKEFLKDFNLIRYVEADSSMYQDFRQINSKYRETICPK